MTMTISQFSEYVQKNYGQSIVFSNVSKTGPDHCPTVSVTLTLPHNGREYYGSGSNQKVAKQDAVNNAVEDMEL